MSSDWLWTISKMVNKYMCNRSIRQNGILAERLDYPHSHADILKYVEQTVEFPAILDAIFTLMAQPMQDTF